MVIHLTPDQEARLVNLAARDGRSPDDLAQDAISRFLDEDARFADAVKLGIGEADRGEFVAGEQLWDDVERISRN